MPVRRTSRRYLALRVTGPQMFTTKEVTEAVQKGVLNLYGVQGLSRIEPVLIEFYEDEQRGILRCNRSHLRETRAVLTFITNIAGSAAAIRVERVSGTIKALKSMDTTPESKI